MRHLTALVVGLGMLSVTLAPVDSSYAQDGWTDAGTAVHLTTGTDRVGIGTTTPATKLHVTGGTRVDGVLQTNVITSRPDFDLRFRVGGVDVLRLEPTGGTPNIIGGSSVNEAWEPVQGGTIGGGGSSSLSQPNVVTDHFGTIGGGLGNRAGDAGGPGGAGDAPSATVAGGERNVASGARSTVGGGIDNLASGDHSTVGGGVANVASGAESTVGGGFRNLASGVLSTVPGGNRGRATHMGSFVWADSSDFDFPSRGVNHFRVRSTGGAQFVSAIDSVTGAVTAGVRLLAGGSSWDTTSDRSLKENIVPVDAADILRRLSAIPIARWNLKAQAPEIKHIGPMAQDFYAAFGLGEDERYINSADADGIALVSIQALYQMVTALEEKTAAVDRKAAELDRKTADLERIAAGVEELRARLARFERAAEAR